MEEATLFFFLLHGVEWLCARDEIFRISIEVLSPVLGEKMVE